MLRAILTAVLTTFLVAAVAPHHAEAAAPKKTWSKKPASKAKPKSKAKKAKAKPKANRSKAKKRDTDDDRPTKRTSKPKRDKNRPPMP